MIIFGVLVTDLSTWNFLIVVNFNPNHQISTRQTLQNMRNRLEQRVRLCFDGPVTDESLPMKVTTKAAALGLQPSTFIAAVCSPLGSCATGSYWHLDGIILHRTVCHFCGIFACTYPSHFKIGTMADDFRFVGWR